MATPSSSIDGSSPKRTPAPAALGKLPKPVLIGLLAFIIVAALGWSVIGFFQKTPEIVIAATSPGEIAAQEIGKVLYTEKTKMRWLSVSVAPAEDKAKVDVAGSVKTKADLDELTKIVEGAKGSATVNMTVKIGE